MIFLFHRVMQRACSCSQPCFILTTSNDMKTADVHNLCEKLIQKQGKKKKNSIKISLWSTCRKNIKWREPEEKNIKSCFQCFTLIHKFVFLERCLSTFLVHSAVDADYTGNMRLLQMFWSFVCKTFCVTFYHQASFSLEILGKFHLYQHILFWKTTKKTGPWHSTSKCVLIYSDLFLSAQVWGLFTSSGSLQVVGNNTCSVQVSDSDFTWLVCVTAPLSHMTWHTDHLT